VPSRAYPAV